MMQQKPACTEPGQWDQAPSAEAPAEIILAWLRHCEDCPYHSMRNLEEDLSMDLLLREACRDLDSVEGRGIWRDAPARRRRSRTTFVRIAMACSVAILVATFWMLSSKGPGESALDELAVAGGGDSVGLSLAAYGMRSGQLYVSRRVADASYGQPRPASGQQPAEQVELVRAPHARGSLLRITNPRNWRAIEVRVAEQLRDERVMLLPARVADSLGLGDSMSVFVEVLSTGRAVGFAP